MHRGAYIGTPSTNGPSRSKRSGAENQHTGAKQKDVTDALQKQVRDLPLITLPSPSYSASFGGDPVPGTTKQLTVRYRINGKAGEASFPEDSIVMLPMPE